MLHVKNIKPLFTSIITTGNRFEEDYYERGIVVASKGDLKVWQTVLAIGSSVRDVQVGDKVMINVDNFAVKKYNKNSIQNDLDNNPTLTHHFNWVTMDDENGNPKDCLFLDNRDILYVFEGEEVEEKIQVPASKTIIV